MKLSFHLNKNDIWDDDVVFEIAVDDDVVPYIVVVVVDDLVDIAVDAVVDVGIASDIRGYAIKIEMVVRTPPTVATAIPGYQKMHTTFRAPNCLFINIVAEDYFSQFSTYKMRYACSNVFNRYLSA